MWDRLPGVTAAAGALAVYLVLGLPLSGLLARRELRRRLTREPGLRSVVYRQTISRLWLLAGVTIGMAGLAGVPLSKLGLRGPSVPAVAAARPFAVALLLVAAVTVFALLVVPAGRGPAARTASLLPATPPERRLYVGVALSAGVVEELLFRGFLVGYLTGALGWSLQSAAAVSAVAFGVSHLYQGLGTAVAAGVIGCGFTEAYVLTGSLLLPVVAHVALDLRVLWTGTARQAAQKCSGASRLSSRSPRWNTLGADVSTPSPATSSSVGAVVDA